MGKIDVYKINDDDDDDDDDDGQSRVKISRQHRESGLYGFVNLRLRRSPRISIVRNSRNIF